MKRFVILTVGKTHSGKSTFAKQLEEQLLNSVVIDQDNHALFINHYYKKILPIEGTNHFKHMITNTIVQYAIAHTNHHLILANANLHKQTRLDLLSLYKQAGFSTIIVYFNVTEDLLNLRIQESNRDTSIFRTSTTFEHVLIRQQNNIRNDIFTLPSNDEADFIFEITEPSSNQHVISDILNIININ